LRKPQRKRRIDRHVTNLAGQNRPKKSKTNVAKTWRTRERSATLQAGNQIAINEVVRLQNAVEAAAASISASEVSNVAIAG
jgi:hypothetical protein